MSCAEVLGKKTQHKEWISSDTIKRIEKGKEKKATENMSRTGAGKVKAQEYAKVDRDIKKNVKKDKKDYIKELASQAENAPRHGNLKNPYSKQPQKQKNKTGRQVPADQQAS
jgi:hypothetical protein